MNKFVHFCKTFFKSQKGTVLVEFAFVFPVMIVLFLGTLETSVFLNTKKGAERSASTMGMLLSKQSYIDDTDMATFQSLAKAVLDSGSNRYLTAKFEVQSMRRDVSGDTDRYCILWRSKFSIKNNKLNSDQSTEYNDANSVDCDDPDDEETQNNLFNDTDTSLVSAADGLITIHLEFEYQPLVTTMFNGDQTVTLERNTVHPVRDTGYVVYCPNGVNYDNSGCF